MTRGWSSVLVVAALSGPAFAQPQKTAADREFEQRARADLAKVSEEAAAAFDVGNAARDADRQETAAAAYRRVVAAAPDVDHGHRRLCFALSSTGQHDEGVAECRRALELAPGSAANKSGLAMALFMRRSAHDLDEAALLARDAGRDPQAGANEVEGWCHIAVAANSDAEIGECTDRLLRLVPDGMVANVLGSYAAAKRGEFELAHQRLDTGHAAGLSDDKYRELRSQLVQEEERADHQRDSIAGVPIPMTFLWALLRVLIAWLAGLALLLGAGYALSRAQLRALVSPGRAARRRGSRRIYRSVLALTGVYLYLTLPLVMVELVLAFTAANVVWAIAGTVRLPIILMNATLAVASVAVIARSLTVRVTPAAAGVPLVLADHPKLRQLLVDVATAVGTRPVDTVYLTPDAELAVSERLGVWASLFRRRAERSLTMGVGLFAGMTQLQLRAVLAHEYGHFRSADAAGGDVALQVRWSLLALVEHHERAGAWFKPAWWCARGCYQVYLGVSQGASRLQEVLADRWAIQAYGSQAFVDGHRHTVALARPPSHDDHDSHPASRQRIEWAEAMAVARTPEADDDAAVWDLFADRDAIERAIGVEIPAAR